MKKCFASIFILVFAYSAQAQELRATVKVVHQAVQRTNVDVFTNMEQALTDFLNTTQFTNLPVREEERIECSFVFNIQSADGNNFKGELQVQSTRPIFNSSYKSPVLNIMDTDLDITYQENQILEFNENVYRSNLTSILGFYAYLIIGMDLETYQRGGGKDFFETAQAVASGAASGGAPGWNPMSGRRGKGVLIENINNPNFEDILDCYYAYHRKGLDKMHDPDKQAAAKTAIVNALMKLEETHKKRPSSYLMQVLMDTKNNEILSIFSDGPPSDTAKLQTLLKQLDGARANQYDALK